MTTGTLGILVGGGPAPGINSVIAAAAIEASNEGYRVLGLFDGFKWLAAGDSAHAAQLEIEDVSRIHWTGGSILRTSRTNPAKDERSLHNCVATLDALGITHLLCIGGDDTTFGAAQIAHAAGGKIRVVTVPKTIDNDLPLPDNMPTFGFETARTVGTAIVETLMEDARTTTRWYTAVCMGRKSGALALGICRAAGGTLAIIPEEFGDERVSFELVADIIIGSMIKRRFMGHDHGVAIIAEGVVEQLDEKALEGLKGAPRDQYGHIRISDLDVGDAVRGFVRERLEAMRFDATVVKKEIGYELRCAKPVPFDVEYTRTLGYGAVRYLTDGGSGALIALRGGKVAPVDLQELIDPQTGRVRTRRVDTDTESYEVGRKYMIRLEKSDFDQPRLGELASVARMTPKEFETRFSATLR
ncbi:MAG: 6-phosphofructokinase [Candidatus Eremiobacteraeota bacterium]|nr:6-phosphofructokinase [Candidatus Eremiobacteraeota bacterium]MBV8222901.1 6-phosphofructokinase [Candidatus Eremiobacteraeota bacterium]